MDPEIRRRSALNAEEGEEEDRQRYGDVSTGA